MKLTRITLISTLFALVVSSAWAGTVRVGPARLIKTIQVGVDSASPGDTVLIDPGFYPEAVKVNTPYLMIQPAKKGKKGQVTITGNGVLPPLRVAHSHASVVKDLVIANFQAAVGISVSYAHSVRILRCKVQGGSAAIGIYGHSTVGLQIQKCEVLQAFDMGIAVFDCQNAVIKKNLVADAGTRGIVVGSGSTTITDNRILRAGSAGIQLGDPMNNKSCTGALVRGNVIEESVVSGIEINAFASSCTVEKNILRDNLLGLSMVDGTFGHSMVGNKLVSNLHGFFLLDCADVTLQKNTSRDNYTNYFLDAATDSVILMKNKSRRADYDGFLVRGNWHTLLKNKSLKSGQTVVNGVDFNLSTATNYVFEGNKFATSNL